MVILSYICNSQAASKVEVDPEAGEKLKISRMDFIHSFENDVKPVRFMPFIIHAPQSQMSHFMTKQNGRCPG